jgi:uncharacterized Rossmann fold enzyme
LTAAEPKWLAKVSYTDPGGGRAFRTLPTPPTTYDVIQATGLLVDLVVTDLDLDLADARAEVQAVASVVLPDGGEYQWATPLLRRKWEWDTVDRLTAVGTANRRQLDAILKGGAP